MRSVALPNKNADTEYRTILSNALYRHMRRLAGYTPRISKRPNEAIITRHETTFKYWDETRPVIRYAKGDVKLDRLPFNQVHNVYFLGRLSDYKTNGNLPRINGISEMYRSDIEYGCIATHKVHKIIGKNGVIAGGAALRLLEREPYDLNDIDVFTFTKDDYNAVCWNLLQSKDVVSNGGYEHYIRIPRGGKIKIDVQKPRWKDIDDLFDYFDLSCCACYIDERFQYVKHKLSNAAHMRIQNYHTPLQTMRRMIKYLGRGCEVDYESLELATQHDTLLAHQWEQVYRLLEEILVNEKATRDMQNFTGNILNPSQYIDSTPDYDSYGYYGYDDE